MSISRQCLEAKHGKVWNADELAQEFVVTAIISPKVVVRRRSDDVVGTLQFVGEFYFNWQPQSDTDGPERIALPCAKFSLGQVVGTPGAISAIEASGQTPDYFLDRHVRGDWGEVCQEDWQLNQDSLIDGSRILSVFRTLKGKRLYVITEAKDDQGHRAATTILLPEDY